jgi:hypothetical protein
MVDQILPDSLREFATPRQLEYLDAVNQHGGIRVAERALGTAPDAIGAAIRRLQKAAAARGFSPDHDYTRPVPAGFVAKGVSTYYNTEGKPTQQWVKSRLDDQAYQEALRAAAEAMAEDLPRLDPLQGPLACNEQLLNLYTLTDCHVGMLAWRKEGGQDWDLKIAEDVLFRCFEQMVTSAPNALVGVVNQLGDFLHSDGLLPVTPTSGHILDQDGRFSKMVRVAIRLLRRIIDLALMKHETVVVLMAEGNHDMASSVWLRIMFQALYEKEPRVLVIDSELPFYAYKHGQTMLAFHHGHLKKVDEFPLTFAAQYSAMWGATTKRYAHAGHRHHLEIKEHGGMIVTQHPTLAARDAYAARGAWFAERAAKAITYHAEYGQVGEITITPEMLA